MSFLPVVLAGILGLGLPELIVIALVLSVLVAPIVVVVIVLLNRGRSSPPSAPPALPRAPEKQCPDCAEAVLLDARVCKHCGCRFEAAPVPSA